IVQASAVVATTRRAGGARIRRVVARYDRPPGFDRARRRRPISPPAPTRRGLSTGPKGLDSVFTATAAAARKPIAAPTAVPVTSVPSIHLRRPATTAAHGLAMSPPIARVMIAPRAQPTTNRTQRYRRHWSAK